MPVRNTHGSTQHTWQSQHTRQYATHVAVPTGQTHLAAPTGQTTPSLDWATLITLPSGAHSAETPTSSLAKVAMQLTNQLIRVRTLTPCCAAHMTVPTGGHKFQERPQGREVCERVDYSDFVWVGRGFDRTRRSVESPVRGAETTGLLLRMFEQLSAKRELLQS